MKVKFKTNKPIALPHQTKSWGYHVATEMTYQEVYKLLAGGAEDIIAILDDGTEVEVTWDNLTEYFPEEEITNIPSTLEDNILVEDNDEMFAVGSEETSYQGPNGVWAESDGPHIIETPVTGDVDGEFGGFAGDIEQAEVAVPPVVGDLAGDYDGDIDGANDENAVDVAESEVPNFNPADAILYNQPEGSEE